MNRRSPSSAKNESGQAPRAAQHEVKTVPELEAELAVYRQALDDARAEFQAFAHSVSHDLRAPLRAIEGFSRILLEDCVGELKAEPQKYLRHVISASQQLSAQLDDLLKFYRAGKQPPTKIEVDTDSVCKEALIGLGHDLTKKASVIQHALPPVIADPLQLREVFALLLANAFKFTSKKENPTIEVGSKVEPGAVTFFVRDNGVGFDMRSAERLFQVFQKLHPATDFPGNGIGLAIVKRLVTAQGGCVSASSEPGKGSVFCFSLPAQEGRVTQPPNCRFALG